jgi:hypothetical protein
MFSVVSVPHIFCLDCSLKFFSYFLVTIATVVIAAARTVTTAASIISSAATKLLSLLSAFLHVISSTHSTHDKDPKWVKNPQNKQTNKQKNIREKPFIKPKLQYQEQHLAGSKK